MINMILLLLNVWYINFLNQNLNYIPDFAYAGIEIGV